MDRGQRVTAVIIVIIIHAVLIWAAFSIPKEEL
ncbi:hypothetical protein FB461_0003 [Rarobacter faecitabidus]|uniref:Uncharacterized protein n=1 Tax=Rarobacter faecitabidus TaxID=13243 RepID=A0A542ZT51_RARFA|nr:hypothetical protein FB461_0003 [Rarobacter faecitabidus]